MSKIAIIGIDVATQPSKVGLALGFYDRNNVEIESVTFGSKEPPLVEIIGDWIQQYSPCRLAMDAPLGWPEPFGPSLVDHQTGNVLRNSPNELFRRKTEAKIYETLKKRPLEVGANMIARAAHSALDLFEELRGYTKKVIPLAWEPGRIERTMVIEVYPAATLIA